MGRVNFVKLTAICLISTTVPSTTAFSAAIQAAQMVGLLARGDNTCALSGYTSCNKAGLPSNFCCPTSSQCIAFNDGKSAICCPSGKDCSTITAISCDIGQQNATAFPKSQLFTTNLSASLSNCGNGCCPQGYSCTNNGECALVATSSAASSSAAAPSNTISSTSTSNQPATITSSMSKTSSSSTILPASSNNHSSVNAKCNQFPATAVLAGFFPGLALGVLLACLLLCCCGRRRAKEQPPASPSFSSVTATVSDPIYQPGNTGYARNDFLRRESRSKYGSRTSRVRSLFSRTPTMRSMRSRDAPVDGIGRSIPAVPKTPENQRSPESYMKKEPSMESIRIYSPPGAGLNLRETTFTDMMHHAGLKEGEPYLGSPGRVSVPVTILMEEYAKKPNVDPRSRGVGGI